MLKKQQYFGNVDIVEASFGLNKKLQTDGLSRGYSAFQPSDTNGDKVVTKAEFEASEMAKMIKSFDVLGPDEKNEVRKPAFIKSFMEAYPAHKTEA